MTEDHPGEEQHQDESALLRAQEHKGYGEDEGEREQLLDRDADATPRRRGSDTGEPE